MSVISDVTVRAADGPRRGRVIEIDASPQNIVTPDRSPTSTENNAKGNIDFDQPFVNPLFEVTKRFWGNSVQKLYDQNGYYSRKKRNVEAQLNKFEGVSVTKFFPQLSNDQVLEDWGVRCLLDLQLEAGCDIIFIPEKDPSDEPEDYHSHFDDCWSYVSSRRTDVNVLPEVRIAQDPNQFEGKLEALAEHEGTLAGINVKYASLDKYRPNYLRLSQLWDKDIWIHCSDIPRMYHYTSPNSVIHSLQLYGVDTASLKLPGPPISNDDGEEGAEEPDSPLQSVRYLDHQSMKLPVLSEVGRSQETLPCDCEVCQAAGSVQEFSQQYTDPEEETPTFSSLNAASKLHGIFRSTQEFEYSRTRIREGNLASYIQEKPGLDELIGEDARQEPLF